MKLNAFWCSGVKMSFALGINEDGTLAKHVPSDAGMCEMGHVSFFRISQTNFFYLIPKLYEYV